MLKTGIIDVYCHKHMKIQIDYDDDLSSEKNIKCV